MANKARRLRKALQRQALEACEQCHDEGCAQAADSHGGGDIDTMVEGDAGPDVVGTHHQCDQQQHQKGTATEHRFFHIGILVGEIGLDAGFAGVKAPRVYTRVQLIA